MSTYETGLAYGPTVWFCEGSDESSVLMKSWNLLSSWKTIICWKKDLTSKDSFKSFAGTLKEFITTYNSMNLNFCTSVCYDVHVTLCVIVEAVHIGSQLCQYGYFFPVSDSKNLVVKDDSSLYRFQVSPNIIWYSLGKYNLSFIVVNTLVFRKILGPKEDLRSRNLGYYIIRKCVVYTCYLDSKGFWWWFIIFRITWFLDFIHYLLF